MQTDTIHPKQIRLVVQLLAFQSRSWILWLLQEGHIRYLGETVLCKICYANTKAMINWNRMMDARNFVISLVLFGPQLDSDVLKIYHASARLVHHIITKHYLGETVLCKICYANTKAMINWNRMMDARNFVIALVLTHGPHLDIDVLKVYHASARLVHRIITIQK